MAVDDLRNELAFKIKEIPPIEKKLKFQSFLVLKSKKSITGGGPLKSQHKVTHVT